MKNMNRKNSEFTKKEFEKTIQNAREIYFSWKNSFSCPFFKSKIHITRSGWQHLMAEQRPKHQKFWRAKYFKYIPDIIIKNYHRSKRNYLF